MPIRRSRHSSASAPPVVTAIFGMWPSACVRGRRVRFGVGDRVVDAGGDGRDRDLPAPLADLDDERDVRAGRDVSTARSVRWRRSARSRSACPTAATLHRSQDDALGDRDRSGRVRDVDDDVVERQLAGRIVDRAADRRLRRARAGRHVAGDARCTPPGRHDRADVGHARAAAGGGAAARPHRAGRRRSRACRRSRCRSCRSTGRRPSGVQVIVGQLGSPQTLATPRPAAGGGRRCRRRSRAMPPQPSPMMPQ